MPITLKNKTLHLLLPALLLATSAVIPAKADDCKQSDHRATYKPQSGDHADSTQLTAARPLSNPVHLTLNDCAGDLQIVRTAEGNPLKLEIKSPGADKSLADYLSDFQTTGSTALINIRVPSRYHPSVILYVPASKAPESRMNLGAGNLILHADALTGKRELNLGAGNADIYLDGDHSYATLEVNIGMGNLKDERAHGQSSSFIVAKTMQGTGKGDLRINLGAGNVTLKSGAE